jgi:hypothetical protein
MMLHNANRKEDYLIPLDILSFKPKLKMHLSQIKTMPPHEYYKYNSMHGLSVRSDQRQLNVQA